MIKIPLFRILVLLNYRTRNYRSLKKNIKNPGLIFFWFFAVEITFCESCDYLTNFRPGINRSHFYEYYFDLAPCVELLLTPVPGKHTLLF